MRIAVGALFIVTVAVGCHSGGDRAGGLVENPRGAASPAEQAALHVTAFESELGTRIQEHLAQVSQADLEVALRSPGALDDFEAPVPELVQAFYIERGHAPVFVIDGGLSEHGHAVYDALSAAWDHALVPSHYGVEAATEALREVEEGRTVAATVGAVVLTDEQRRQLVDYVTSRHDLLDMEPARLQDELAGIVLAPSSGNDSPVPHLHDSYQDALGQVARGHEAAARLEVLLAAGFLRYAWDMRYRNPAWFDGEIREDANLLEQAQHTALLDALRRGTTEGFAAVITALPPHFQQYTRLLESHRRYRAIVEAGGWRTDLEAVTLTPGRDHDMVPRLRERLHAEGYFDGDLTSRTYDSEIRAAYEHYQITHQFEDDGEFTEGEVNSLNVPALERARQIAVALRRWRESAIGNETYYVQVNIPDFHAEVWRDGNRDMRFRIIVGDNMRVRRRDNGEMMYPRATPELDRPMRYVVFNPYWNVPRQIMIEEYDPNLVEDPKWYENNGYEVLYNEYGQRWVRQLPGPANALGEVKFLFPNDYDVYLHDTPTRNLFSRPVRDFSHGCMRVHNPMALAEYILANDRGWDRDRIDRERASGEESWVTLRTPIPVHVDYYVVHVDDDGFPNFGGDIYARDRERMAEVEADEQGMALARATGHVVTGVSEAVGRTEEGFTVATVP